MVFLLAGTIPDGEHYHGDQYRRGEN